MSQGYILLINDPIKAIILVFKKSIYLFSNNIVEILIFREILVIIWYLRS